jgi:NTE family protein
MIFTKRIRLQLLDEGHCKGPTYCYGTLKHFRTTSLEAVILRRALVLSGGGCKGAFEVGALHYLICETGLDFQILLGSSVGALNAAVLGQARNLRQLQEQTKKLTRIWEGITGNNSIYRSNLLGVINLFLCNALYQPVGLRQIIAKNIDPALLCDNPYKSVLTPAVAIETGELYYADTRKRKSKETILDYITASASIPIFFPPVKIDGKHWYDGGLRDLTPLGGAFKEHSEEVYVILTFPVNDNLEPILNKVVYRGVLKSLLRIANIINSEISANDLQLVKLTNQYYRLFGKKRVPTYIIAPRRPLQGHVLDFAPSRIKENMKLGYEAAKRPVLF